MELIVIVHSPTAKDYRPISIFGTIIHFPPDSRQPFSGFKAQTVENAPFGATLSETLQKPVDCQGV